MISIPNKIFKKGYLSSSEFNLYCRLVYLCHEHGTTHLQVTQDKLAEMFDMSKKSVNTHLKGLIDKGLVELIISGKKEGRGRTSSTYIIKGITGVRKKTIN